MATIKRKQLKPRGRPFEPGNPGRPPGARNKATRAIEQLAEGHAKSLGEKVMELALGGDVACLRMMLRSGLPDTERPADKRESTRRGPRIA